LAFGGQGGLPALAEHAVSVINAVTAIYRNPPANDAQFPYTVQVVLVGQQTFVEDDPWESEVAMVGEETDCSSLLDKFNEWGQRQLDAGTLGRSYDNRLLLSGRDFDGSTVGLAGVSTMCNMPRSGSVNMCSPGADELATCAGVVAHEMGHNFGMGHDSTGNDCEQSGYIMNAVMGATAPNQFSSCSVTYINSYFSSTYSENGECLENTPTHVEGDPICGNGFVESGEDCDCASSDCSTTDACCDGSTCKFASPSYECSDAAGQCCEGCMFAKAEAGKVCRAATGTCDVPEVCPGGTAECPMDHHAYPGKPCDVQGYSGLCFAGRCNSLELTCTVDMTRDFEGSFDYNEKCGSFNDDCQQLVCHNASMSEPFACVQSFALHGKQLTVPDGSPCWFPGSQLGSREGMCYDGRCRLPHSLAEAPLCGNGGIDFGEQCDCGQLTEDSCCDCATCMLKPGKQCSSQEACCSSTCEFKAAGTTCRSAVGECDEAEVCSGQSGQCPWDSGKKWGTNCTTSGGKRSTCYGKVCMTSLDEQCASVTEGLRPVANLDVYGRVDPHHLCTSLSCCATCTVWDGTYNVDGTIVKDPVICEDCSRSTSYSDMTVGETTRRIYLKGPMDGAVLSDPAAICINAESVKANTTCASGTYLATAVGLCVPCDSSCVDCTGPSNFDCFGECKYGQDSRGACAITAEQVLLAPGSSPTSSSATTASTSSPSTSSSSIPGTVTTYTETTTKILVPVTPSTTQSTSAPSTTARTPFTTTAGTPATSSTAAGAPPLTFTGTSTPRPGTCVYISKRLALKHNIVPCPEGE